MYITNNQSINYCGIIMAYIPDKTESTMKRTLIMTGIITLAAMASAPQRAEAQYRTDVPAIPVTDNRIWTLHDCMAYAVEHSPQMTLQQAANDDRRIDKREAALDFIPKVNASVSGSADFGRMVDPETNVYINSTVYSNSYGLSASMDIFNGFTAVNNLRIAKTAVQLGIEEEQITKDDICLQVIQAYYNVLYNQGMRDLAEEQLAESRETLRQAKVQAELGLKSEADVLQIESDLANKEYNLTKMDNTLEQSVLTLKSAMYFPFDENLEVAAIEPSAMFGKLNSESNADSIVSSAHEYLPSLKAEDFKVRNAEFSLKTAKWSLAPYIYAQGGYSTGYVYDVNGLNDPFLSQINAKQGQYVGIGISIPIFNKLSKFNNIAKKRNALATAKANRDIKYQEVESEIRRAVQDMRGAAMEYVSADKQVNAVDLSHKANVRKYEEGLMSVIELQTSSNSLLEAKANRLNCGLQYLLKERIVMYYKGITYLNQE